jgi:hypothetical protein
MTQFKQVAYSGWQTCYRASNGRVEVIVTGEVGPRVIRFGFVDGPNLLKEYPERINEISGDKWVNFGGHRLWHAPEVNPRTYYPDNQPVQIEHHEGFTRFTQATELTTGIQKEIDITLSGDRDHVHLVHRLRNHNVWGVELAPWSISVMEAGGTAILPLPPRGEHPRDLQPVNTLAIWTYTDISDSRWTWGRKYILLRQDAHMADPEKIGALVPDGWAGYVLNGQFFMKTFPFVPNATYPDLGCSAELFTNKTMLEVESLGPLAMIPPGKSVEHVEDWYLFDNVSTPDNDEEVDAYIMPQVEMVRMG